MTKKVSKNENPVLAWRWSILKSDLPSSTRLVLLTLSVHMNDEGENCYPSIESLCEETGLSNRALINHIHKAASDGWILVDKRRKTGRAWAQNYYRIGWPKSHKVVNEVHHPKARGSELGDGEVVNEVHHPIAQGSERGSPPRARGSELGDVEVVNEVHTNSTENSTNKNISSEQAPIVEDAVRFNEGKWAIDNAVFDLWLTSYQNGRTHRDTEDWIEAELAKASAWLIANPRKRKKKLLQFLNNWLTRASQPAPRLSNTKRGYH